MNNDKLEAVLSLALLIGMIVAVGTSRIGIVDAAESINGMPSVGLVNK